MTVTLAVSIRCFATGTSRLHCFFLCPAGSVSIRCFATGTSRHIDDAAAQAAPVSIRCFATGTSRLDGSPRQEHHAFLFAVSRQVLLDPLRPKPKPPRKRFYSLFRDRYFSTVVRPISVPQFGFLFAVSRQVLLDNLISYSDSTMDEVSIRCFATGTSRHYGCPQTWGIIPFLFAVSRQVLLDRNQVCVARRPQVSIRCFATGTSRHGNSRQRRGSGRVSIRCFATGTSRPQKCLSARLPMEFLFAVSRQVLLDSITTLYASTRMGFYSLFRDRYFSTGTNHRDDGLRRVSIRCFATGTSRRVG